MTGFQRTFLVSRYHPSGTIKHHPKKLIRTRYGVHLQRIMFKFAKFILAALALSFSASAISQAPTIVDKTAMLQHVEHRTWPLYPDEARYMLYEGTVVLDVRVGTDGSVEQAKVVSGPIPLRQSAIDCALRWIFRPFLKDSQPIVVSGKVSIEYQLNKSTPSVTEERKSMQYESAIDTCKSSLADANNYKQAALDCKSAANLTSNFSPERRCADKVEADVYTAWSLVNSGDVKSGLEYVSKAVEIVKLGFCANSRTSSVYYTRAAIEEKLSDMNAAEADLAQTVIYARKAFDECLKIQFDSPEKPKQLLINSLRAHAQILDELGRSSEAKNRQREADKLQE